MIRWIPTSTPPVLVDDYNSAPVLATDGKLAQVCRLTKSPDLGDGEPPDIWWQVVGPDAYRFENVTHWAWVTLPD